MKQRISTSQLNELTPSQQEKLRAWWKPEQGHWYHDYDIDEDYTVFDCGDDDYYSHLPDEDCLPLLNIGQHIELLNCMVNINNAFAEYPKAWCVMNMNKKKEYWAEELIDALWEVVKSIL